MLLKCVGQDISLNVILDEENLVDSIMYNHTKNVSFKNNKKTIEFTQIPGNPAPRCLNTRVGSIIPHSSSNKIFAWTIIM